VGPRLFERFIGFLGRLGGEQPALAVIEDVQWIDPATHDLITFLVRNVTTEHLVAILTCRTDDLPAGHPVLAWMAELGRAPGGVRVDLGRLGEADIARQLEAIQGGPVADRVVDAIWRRSEGHPLFAEELLSAAGPDSRDLPSLVEVLLGRVGSLDPSTLAVVETLAVAGRPVDERLIGPLVDRSEGTRARAGSGPGCERNRRPGASRTPRGGGSRCPRSIAGRAARLPPRASARGRRERAIGGRAA